MSLSAMVLNNTIQWKMDKIADVSINGLFYFTIFRRFNSPYEIVVEYENGDTYLQKDGTIRQSLQRVLCLSKEQITSLYTTSVYSYKHHGAIDLDVVDQRWSAIQRDYGAVLLNLGGILEEFQASYEAYQEEKESPKNEIVEPSWVQKEEPCMTETSSKKRRCEWVCPYEYVPESCSACVKEYMILRNGKRIAKRGKNA